MINEDRRANIATGILLTLIKTTKETPYIKNMDDQVVFENNAIIQAVRMTDALIKQLEK